VCCNERGDDKLTTNENSADFTHNITDGLAMSASFYASPTVGASTTLAVFLHEIPHEVGDFALLVQSGFSKRAAMGAQFVTAIGAFLGTLIGIFIQEFGGSNAEDDMSMTGGIWGTSLVSCSLFHPPHLRLASQLALQHKCYCLPSAHSGASGVNDDLHQ